MDSNPIPDEESQPGLSRGNPFAAKAGEEGAFQRENPSLDVPALVHIKKMKTPWFWSHASDRGAPHNINNYQMGLTYSLFIYSCELIALLLCYEWKTMIG